MIKIGDKIPNLKMKVIENGQVGEQEIASLFDDHTVILFGVPGAFTPTCSNSHLPSFVKNFDTLKEKGINRIICLAVNDTHVLSAWSKTTASEDKITFLADGSGKLAKSMGLYIDLSDYSMGIRSKRFSMIVKDGTVSSLHVEDNPGICTISDALTILEDL